MPKELTAEQKAAYIADGWSSCPFCSSPEISGGHVDIEGREAWQNVDCTVCGAAWRDVYHLAEIEVIDAPETIPEAGNRIDQLTEQIIPAVDAALVGTDNPEADLADASIPSDPLYGQRMDSADLGEN